MELDRKTVQHYRSKIRLGNLRGRLAKTKEDESLVLAHPGYWAEIVLGMRLSPKQMEVLNYFRKDNTKAAVMAANGAGKTARILPALVHWHQFVYPGGKVKVTSGSYTQIEDQVWPAIRTYKEKFPHYHWLETPYFSTRDEETGREGFCNCFTTNHPGRAEGDHADGEIVRAKDLIRDGGISDPEELDRLIAEVKENPDLEVNDGSYPLLYIVDEAKTCPEWLEGVIVGRVRPSRLLIMSSPGFSEGWFYKAMTSDDSFKRFTITADDCPWISKQEIADIRHTWREYPEFAGAILGENFLNLVENAVINGKALDENLANPPPRRPDGDRHLFCDFAWSGSGDENVAAERRGNVITLAECFHSDHLMATTKQPTPGIVERFIGIFLRLGYSPGDAGKISGDEGGGGKLVLDALEQRGWYLNRVNNGATAADSDHYANVAAEMWFEGGKQIHAKTYVLPQDKLMRGQMLNRKQLVNKKGKLALESKEDMRARGVPSPDRAEAVIFAMAPTGGYATDVLTWAAPVAVGRYSEMMG